MTEQLRVFAEDPQPERKRAGYYPMPRAIMGLEMSMRCKLVLAAILGRLQRGEVSCAVTARTLQNDSESSRWAVEESLRDLVTHGLIYRNPNPENPGGPWLTTIRFDPLGITPPPDFHPHPPPIFTPTPPPKFRGGYVLYVRRKQFKEYDNNVVVVFRGGSGDHQSDGRGALGITCERAGDRGPGG